MSKLQGRSGVDSGRGRASSWRHRLSRFFSCVGLGGEAASSFDQADAPITPSAAGPAPSTIRKESAVFVVEPAGLTASASESCLVTVSATGDHAELEAATAPADGKVTGGGALLAANLNLSASSDSLDFFVSEYVERCRSIRQPRDASFGDIFARVPGCRPSTLFSSHAAHLRDLAPWMELSCEAESVPSSFGPDYDVEEFGNVDVTCQQLQYVDDTATDATVEVK